MEGGVGPVVRNCGPEGDEVLDHLVIIGSLARFGPYLEL